MITYKPPEIGKKGTAAAAAAGCAAVVLFIASFLFETVSIYLEVVSIVFLAAAVRITSRYVLTAYTYKIGDVTAPHEEMTLSVIKNIGPNDILVGIFDVSEIYAFEKQCEMKLSDFTGKYGEYNKRLDFRRNMKSPDLYYLAVRFKKKKVLLTVEFSDDFANELKKRICATDMRETAKPENI